MYVCMYHCIIVSLYHCMYVCIIVSLYHCIVSLYSIIVCVSLYACIVSRQTNKRNIEWADKGRARYRRVSAITCRCLAPRLPYSDSDHVDVLFSSFTLVDNHRHGMVMVLSTDNRSSRWSTLFSWRWLLSSTHFPCNIVIVENIGIICRLLSRKQWSHCLLINIIPIPSHSHRKGKACGWLLSRSSNCAFVMIYPHALNLNLNIKQIKSIVILATFLCRSLPLKTSFVGAHYSFQCWLPWCCRIFQTILICIVVRSIIYGNQWRYRTNSSSSWTK